MLKNYEKLLSGVVKQKRIKRSISAEKDYLDYYTKLGPLVDQMSYLRLGYILGVINRPFSLLDIGYGNGSFLKCASGVIPNCYGYDIKPTPLPEDVIRVNNMYGRHYDLITFFDSLEHFTAIDFVADLKCMFVVVSVPECHNAADTEWFLNWKHRKPDEHLFHFSKKALIKHMSMCGYIPISISNVEDTIRGNLHGKTNILTGVFKKLDVDKQFH